MPAKRVSCPQLAEHFDKVMLVTFFYGSDGPTFVMLLSDGGLLYSLLTQKDGRERDSDGRKTGLDPAGSSEPLPEVHHQYAQLTAESSDASINSLVYNEHQLQKDSDSSCDFLFEDVVDMQVGLKGTTVYFLTASNAIYAYDQSMSNCFCRRLSPVSYRVFFKARDAQSSDAAAGPRKLYVTTSYLVVVDEAASELVLFRSSRRLAQDT